MCTRNVSIIACMRSQDSHIKGRQDMLKYEKARALKTCVHTIRRDYMEQVCNGPT